MPDSLSDRYEDLLTGSYDCVDRVVLNAYFRMGHDPGGFRLWWRANDLVGRNPLTKKGNCFTHITDAAGLAKIADTWSEPRTIGRVSQACERWIYTARLCFVLDRDERKRSGFHYQYSNCQVEYSRNLIFEIGGHMDQVFQALIDRSRVLLDLKTVKTILGYKHRPKYRKRKRKSAEWEVAVEKPGMI